MLINVHSMYDRGERLRFTEQTNQCCDAAVRFRAMNWTFGHEIVSNIISFAFCFRSRKLLELLLLIILASCCFAVLKMKNTSSDDEVQNFLEFVEDRPYNDLRYSMDSSRLHQLGWTPQVTWQQGIEQTSKNYVHF